MNFTAALFAAALGLPLLLLLASSVPVLRPRLAGWFAIAPLPALVAALAADHGSMLTIGNGSFALRFALDAPGAMLLGVAALLWFCSGIYAARWLRDRGEEGRDGFIVCWFMTLTGCVGVFLAADLIGFYFLLAVLSVGASGLVLQGGGPQAFRASALYLGLALAAEAFLLVGLILLAQATPDGSLLIRDAAAALADSPTRGLTLTLLLIGLCMKAGLVPMHFWMPLAYGSAPLPAAAVMSGAVVKASIVALVRFLPLGTALPDFGLPMAALGLFGALYGVAIGITQKEPKLVLAYSSVSQMGFLVAVIGMGFSAGDKGTAMAAAFYAAHHLLVKGALFLAIGAALASGRRRPWLVLVPAAVIALGLGGLPLTGGALAKYAAKDLLGDGLAASVAVVSSVASSLLMIHFVRRLAAAASQAVDASAAGRPAVRPPASQAAARPPASQAAAGAPFAITASWLAMALASLLVPWALYLDIPLATLPKALAPDALWAALWPVLVGLALAWLLERVAGLLPRIPAGDIGIALGRLDAVVSALGGGFVRLDAFARRWTVACIALLLLTLLFGFALMAIDG